MATGTVFRSHCPTCGRKLEIRVELLGRIVACQHCGATHVACEDRQRVNNDQHVEQVLARARAYIASVEAMHSATSETT